MLIAIIILSCICIYLAVRLILLKGTIRTLASEFREARKNLRGEQHVQITSIDKDLEKLAVECNEFINEYFEKQYSYKKDIKAIRNEITNLSHDLRTPITSILGYICLLQEEELTQSQLESLEVVKRRSEDLNSLIEQLYDYVRLENNEMLHDMERIDLFKILREHLLSFYNEFERKGIELTFDFKGKEEPIWIFGDVNYIERVLSNMTSNTIKYGESNVLVSLECNENHVSVTYQSPRGTLDDYDIDHLFDRFYKKDKVRGENRSSGLGLTITKLYVEQMNGQVNVWGDQSYLYIGFSFNIIEK